MVFHKTAIDVLAKGLNPTHPHKTLGLDGMLIGLPSQKKEEDLTVAVFSITGSECDVGTKPHLNVTDKVTTNQTEEKVTIQQTTESVIPKTGRRPPVRTPKVPQE